MNNYRCSWKKYGDAQDHADRLRRRGASSVAISETSHGWDVTWKQP